MVFLNTPIIVRQRSSCFGKILSLGADYTTKKYDLNWRYWNAEKNTWQDILVKSIGHPVML